MPKAKLKTSPPAAPAGPVDRKGRDLRILFAAGILLSLLLVLGLIAPALISMRSTFAVACGFLLLAACLAGAALVVDRMVLAFWRGKNGA